MCLLEELVQLGEHAFDVAHNGDIGSAVLADFRRVDVHMDHLGMRGEGSQAAGDAVIETDAEGDQQVGAAHGHVRGITAVHAGHADEVGMLRGKAA